MFIHPGAFPAWKVKNNNTEKVKILHLDEDSNDLKGEMGVA